MFDEFITAAQRLARTYRPRNYEKKEGEEAKEAEWPAVSI
jgi:hypothetical protein